MNTRLTPTEKRCIDALQRAEGPVNRKDLHQAVWRIAFMPQTNRLDVLICRLKKKNFMIVTHRNLGYSLDSAQQEDLSGHSWCSSPRKPTSVLTQDASNARLIPC